MLRMIKNFLRGVFVVLVWMVVLFAPDVGIYYAVWGWREEACVWRVGALGAGFVPLGVFLVWVFGVAGRCVDDVG